VRGTEVTVFLKEGANDHLSAFRFPSRQQMPERFTRNIALETPDDLSFGLPFREAAFLRVRSVPASKASLVVSVGRLSRLIVRCADDGLARKVYMNGPAAPADGAER
jgi:hypothetical protein